MLGTATSHSALTAADLEEKYRRVIDRRGRLEQFVGMRAPGIVIRNERRMLKASVDELFGDSEVEEIVSFVGAGVFANYFKYISGIADESPAMAASAEALSA